MEMNDPKLMVGARIIPGYDNVLVAAIIDMQKSFRSISTLQIAIHNAQFEKTIYGVGVI